jgi:hypothetical protein
MTNSIARTFSIGFPSAILGLSDSALPSFPLWFWRRFDEFSNNSMETILINISIECFRNFFCNARKKFFIFFRHAVRPTFPILWRAWHSSPTIASLDRPQYFLTLPLDRLSVFGFAYESSLPLLAGSGQAQYPTAQLWISTQTSKAWRGLSLATSIRSGL